MKLQSENQTITESNELFELAAMMVLGDRTEQQDCIGWSLETNGGMVVLCDGMGGHQGGSRASAAAVDCFLSAYTQISGVQPSPLLAKATMEANKTVCNLKDPDGLPLKAGSTLAAVILRDGELFWSSVGDSRVYLARGDAFVQITQDQNYRTVLDEQLRSGAITAEEYNRNLPRAEALISYLGIGDLRLVDHNSVPLGLCQGDKLILMSDGLYKLLPDEVIFRILENFSSPRDALHALEMKVRSKAKNSAVLRDNMTVALIKLK